MATLRDQVRQVGQARQELGVHLDELERRLMPGHVGKVGLRWAKRHAKKHPLPWTIATVALGGLIIGLVSWATVDDSAD